jgi:hypothetical protein
VDVQEKGMSLSGSKTHPLWYVDVGRKAKKETVANMQSMEARNPRLTYWQKGS